MGVLNATPDSFSDGGRFEDAKAALAHARRLIADGADILDVGGESTRPGSVRVPQDQELARVLPVIERLAAHGAVVSVDTTRAAVAERAVAAGARIVNDVSGGLADPEMGRAVAETGAAYVAMHWRGHADVMDDLEVYDDVVADVRDELAARMAALHDDGVRPDQLILDPGLGFAKAGVLNWPLLAHLDALHQLGRPVLVGASRKRFLGHLLADQAGRPAPPRARDDATAAISALSAAAGAWCVRVHTVRASVDAVKVAAAWTAADGDARVGSPGTSSRSAPEALTSTVALTTESWTAGGQDMPTWQDSGARNDDGGGPR